MALSPAERQRRFRERKRAEIANMTKVPCACGCGTLIAPINKKWQPARYAHGHNPVPDHTKFQPGHDPTPAIEARKRQGKYRGPGHASWNGGEWKLSSGYVRVTLSPEEARTHPTALQHSGRNSWSIQRTHRVWNQHHPDDPVMPGDHIHHLNHVRDDDRIENLEKRDGSEHIAAHALADPQPRDPETGRFVPR